MQPGFELSLKEEFDSLHLQTVPQSTKNTPVILSKVAHFAGRSEESNNKLDNRNSSANALE
jgi:hypothetical protein